MIGPIDPTGRADRHVNRKLFRLLILLAGVFVVGTGIGWIVGQIGRPVSQTGAQNVATTLPTSTTGADSLLPPAPQPAPATPPQPTASQALPQPAAATPGDQHAATNFIAQATQQTVPPTATPAEPQPPVHAAANPPPAPPAAPKSEPEVVIEPAGPAAGPPAVANAGAAPKPQPASAASKPAATRHHAAPRAAAKHRTAEGPARVTVIGAKGAPAGTRWTVQLGAFKTHDHAALLVMTLQAHGTAANIVKRDNGAKGLWYLVQTPSVTNLKAAMAAATTISRRERVAAYVLRAPAA